MKNFVVLFLSMISLSAFSQNLTDDGAWCWFSDPRAVYFKGSHERIYAGWITSNGDVVVGYYDYSDRKISTNVLKARYEKDDHDNPALLFRPDGRLMVFFTKHGGANPTLMFTAKNAEDISSWDMKELHLNDMEYYRGFSNENTYVNPIMLTEEDNRIYLFWRGVDNKPNYSFSDDLGDTWSKGRIFILPERIYAMRRPYVKVESNGRDRIAFAFTDGHPNMEKENSIYYMYYQRGSFFNVKGEKIGELGDHPVSPAEASVVYNARVTQEKAWIWDIALDKNDLPVLVFARFPNDSNHVYTRAKWNGSEWIVRDLINSGSWFPSDSVRERNYSGGIVLDHENPDIVYMSVKRDSRYEIEKWETRNETDWKIESFTKNSERDHVRPVAVRNARSDSPVQLLWLELTRYVHYTDYLSSVRMY